ncbi:MAG: hypothetical protein LBQ34_03800, partial [Alphaproteobacteria bacterium]|nr:hypothetical protein [Alphaproteobacteria bacterium]
MTKYKLGLDIGTSSIGWAVIAFEEVETDGKSEPVDIPLEIVKSGVRLFSDGREPDSKISLASGRSTLKAQRKQKQRKFNRVKLLNEYLLKQNIISQADLDGNVYTLNAYEARNNAVSAKPELNKVLRAILHLNKHRGYFDNSIIKPNLEAIKAKEEKDILKVMEDYLGEDNQFISLSEEQKEEFVADILKIRKTKVVQENKDIYIFKTEDKEQFCNKWQSNFSNEELDKLFEEKDKKTIKTDIVKELKNAKGLKDDESRIKKGIPHLAKILEKENLTLGQFLYQKDLENEKLAKNKDTFTSQKSVRFTPESEFFASRKMYEAEFEKIRTNSLNHNILNTEQWNRIRDIIFKQYPLQSKEHLIGNCGLEIGEKVASKTSSVFQKFRSLQFLNNLQYAFVDSESDRVSYKNLNSKEKIDLLNILNKENLTTSKLEKYFNNKDKILKTNWKTSDEEGSDKGVLFKRNNTFSTMADYLG